MKRVPLVVANWKMNHTASDAAAYAGRLRARLSPLGSGLDAGLEAGIEVAVAPAFPVLDRLGRALAGSGIALAAQDLHEESSGAFTGEVSLPMLEELGCRYVLVGHSERRQLYGDGDERVARKLERALGSAVRPILCVGETLSERESGQVEAVLARQLEAPIRTLSSSAGRPDAALACALVIAYEPVWAIGTGRVATPEIAQNAHQAIRRLLARALGDAGDPIRILYGGSLKPSNARSLLEQPDVDGALVGSASLDPLDFARIVSTCRETRLEPA